MPHTYSKFSSTDANARKKKNIYPAIVAKIREEYKRCTELHELKMFAITVLLGCGRDNVQRSHFLSSCPSPVDEAFLLPICDREGIKEIIFVFCIMATVLTLLYT